LRQSRRSWAVDGSRKSGRSRFSGKETLDRPPVR